VTDNTRYVKSNSRRSECPLRLDSEFEGGLPVVSLSSFNGPSYILREVFKAAILGNAVD